MKRVRMRVLTDSGADDEATDEQHRAVLSERQQQRAGREDEAGQGDDGLATDPVVQQSACETYTADMTSLHEAGERDDGLATDPVVQQSACQHTTFTRAVCCVSWLTVFRDDALCDTDQFDDGTVQYKHSMLNQQHLPVFTLDAIGRAAGEKGVR